MNFHVITLFPEMISSYTDQSIIGRAQKNNIIKVNTLNLRNFSLDKHKKVDDRSYGGGPGMVMYAEPILRAIDSIKIKNNKKIEQKIKVIIFAPAGKEFTNTYAKNLIKKYSDVILICGRYEGIDARLKKILKTNKKYDVEEVSIGDYVLTGGEIPALVVIDATSRQIEGVLGKSESLEESRNASSELYTRPEILEYKIGKEKKIFRVPKVLLSGNHKDIEEWRDKKDKKK